MKSNHFLLKTNIKNDVNMMIDYKLHVERKNDFGVNYKLATKSVIHTIEKLLQEQSNKNLNEVISRKIYSIKTIF